MSLREQRAKLGLKTPTYPEKQLIWSRVRSDTAGIQDGYVPLGTIEGAHQADARGVAVSGGWRSGKSLSSGMEGVAWLPYADLIWLVAKDYNLTKQEFLYLAEGGISTGLVSTSDIHLSMNPYQPSAMKSNITGCMVETRTLADPMKLAARPPDVVIVCEPGLIENLNLVMELLWGRVSEKRGCIWLAGTSDEASEEWYELWEQWSRDDNPYGGKSFSIPTWENLYRFPEGRAEREFQIYEQAYGLDALLAHYGGMPASPRDLVLRNYWKYSVHVNEEIEFDPDRPTEIAIDPNYAEPNRYSVEVVQWDMGSGQIYIVDEVAVAGMTHDEVRELCEAKEWWPYVSGGTLDPHSGDNHPYGNPAPLDYWQPLDLRVHTRPKVNTTVQALKQALSFKEDGQPRLQVSPKCERLIYEASRWRSNKYGRPLPNNCDALKAIGYWLVEHFSEELMAGGPPGRDNIVSLRDFVLE